MTREEEMALRELAAGRCTIQKVVDTLGPMSLWSKHALEQEIAKAVAAERTACAHLVENMQQAARRGEGLDGWDFAAAIRARGHT